jgi:hypothetical protein
MKMKAATLAILLGANVATVSSAAPVVGGYAYSYADADRAGGASPTAARNVVTDGSIATSTANQSAGARTSTRSQTGAWLNRIEITSTATDPPSIVFGNALSLFAINQKVTGAPGSRPLISYTFGLDGSFTPGPAGTYPSQFLGPQALNFGIVAYRGRALSTRSAIGPNGDYLEFVSTNGTAILGQGAANTNPNDPFLLGGAVACPSFAGSRCQLGGTFSDTRTLSFNAPVGTDYFVLGFLSSDTNGQVDFFNTAKLESIDLAPEFGLESEDGGALRRNANGSFVLAVPEPASWMMLITGFGLAGAALRRRTAASIRTVP